MLDKIIKFSINNKLIIGIFTLLLIVWGIWSASKIPIDAQPDITNNQVQVITLCPTLAGEEVEQLVTFPIEQSLVNLPKIEEIRSVSRFGLSVVTVVFEEEVDVYFARQLVNERLAEAQELIPEGIGKPSLAPVSTGLGEVYQYILHPKKGSEDKYSAMDLRTMQDWIVARQLYGTPGIAEINSFGGQLKQYEVAINPDRLQAMQISIPEVFQALKNNNENTGGAYIDKKPNAYFIRGIGLVKSLEDVGNIVVKKQDDQVLVFIKDIAEVRLGSAIRYGAMTYNGEVDAVGGIVMMLKGENSNEVVKKIKAKLPSIQKSLPDDIVIEPYLDRTDLVGRTLQTVEKNLIEGALIVIFVLILFLGNFRAGLIVASAIPLALLFALGMMKLFGVSANLMSLGAIDFGLIVDGSLIVVEATLHHLALKPGKRTQAEMDKEVFESAAKIRTSAAFGEIMILIVYIPILSLVGIEGKMFAPMAKTVGFAILGALILSFTYIPMMSALVLSKNVSAKQTFSDRMMNYLQGHYSVLLQGAMRYKKALVGVTVLVFAGSIFLFSRMGGEFLPKLGEGDFAFHCILPQGTSLSQSIETSMQASRLIKEFDEVKMVVGKTGAAEVPTDPMPPEATDLMILLKPQSEWKTKKSYEELSAEMMERLEVIPGVFFEANQPIQMRFNELMTGIRQDVAIKIFGEDMDTLVRYATAINKIVQSVDGSSAPQVERVAGLPQINIEYDRNRMANYGLDIETVNAVVSTAFAGMAAGVVYENERRFDLVVRLDDRYRSSIEDVRKLFIPLPNGNQIPLEQIAAIDYKLGPAQISREDGKRRVYVGFNVQGRDVASVIGDIEKRIDAEIKLPSGYFISYGGQFENLQKASDRLLVAVPISLLLIFVLLYFTFHSLKEASLVFAAIPMSAIGGIFALMARGMPFSISAGVGFIALFGVAVLNGIVLISTFNRLEKEGWTDIRARILEGTKMRLRPVLMTATVASLGFLPMALSTSAGAEVQKPLATVVIGGLVSATFLTLFVLPLLYYMVFGKGSSGSLFSVNGKRGIATLLVLFSISGMGMAQNNVKSLEDLIGMAEARNLQLKSQDMRITGAALAKKSAFELPGTSVNFTYGNNEGFEYNDGIRIGQSLPFPSLFVAKKRAAEQEFVLAEKRMDITKNSLVRDVRTSYYHLQYLYNNEGVLLFLDSLYSNFVDMAKLRYEAGDTKRIDISTAETKRGEILLLLAQNKVGIQNTYRQLRVMLQDDSWTVAKEPVYRAMELANLLDTTQLRQHPQIQALYEEARLAEQNKRVLRSGYLPEIALAYNNASLIGNHSRNGVEQFYGRGQRFSFVEVGVTVPLTYGLSRGKVQAQEYERQALEQEAQLAEQQLKAAYQQAVSNYAYAREQYIYYRDSAQKNAQEIIRAAELSYSAGEISYMEYLYSLQTASDLQLKYLQSIQEVNTSVVTIHSYLNL